MRCRDVVGFLSDYLAGEVPPGERARFEEHLRECEACVVYLQTYGDTIRLGKLACAEDGAVPADVPEELVAAVMAARKR